MNVTKNQVRQAMARLLDFSMKNEGVGVTYSTYDAIWLSYQASDKCEYHENLPLCGDISLRTTQMILHVKKLIKAENDAI